MSRYLVIFRLCLPGGRFGRWVLTAIQKRKRIKNQDFEKRTTATDVSEQRITTFVFVTPRDWQKKDEWIEEKKAHSHWKDIVVIDANDLEHWIEQAPAVDLWFATFIAISSMISAGVRCEISSPPLGFFTLRSKVVGSIVLASTLQLLGESAKVFCNSTNSARSSSLSGFVLPMLRPGSSW